MPHVGRPGTRVIDAGLIVCGMVLGFVISMVFFCPLK